MTLFASGDTMLLDNRTRDKTSVLSLSATPTRITPTQSLRKTRITPTQSLGRAILSFKNGSILCKSASTHLGFDHASTRIVIIHCERSGVSRTEERQSSGKRGMQLVQVQAVVCAVDTSGGALLSLTLYDC